MATQVTRALVTPGAASETLRSMLTWTRISVRRRVIRPGMMSGGMKKLIQDSITNITEGK